MKEIKAAKKILVIEDEAKFFNRYKSALLEKNVTICEATSLDVARRYLADEHCGLLIHAVHKNETCQKICNELTKEFPDIPTLHVTSDHGLNKHPIPKGSHNGFVRYLSSEKDFLKKVKQLWRAGKVRSKMANMARILRDQRELDLALDAQEPEKLMARFMGFAQEKLKTKNVIWLVEGDLDYYLNHHWKVKSMESYEKQREFGKRSVAFNAMEPIEISEIVESLHGLIPGGITQNYSPIEVRSGSRHFRSAIVVSIRSEGKFYGHLIFLDPEAMPHKDVFQYWIERLALSYRHALSYLEAKGLCYIDDVTEFYNQRYLGMALEAEISRSNRNDTEFSVLFIDVDHFKRVNDSKGHLVGSKILSQLSKILRRNIRGIDYGFRYGGDEFILLLANTGSEGAMFVGERIRSEVERTIFRIDEVELRITLSIGVATYPSHAMTKEQIIDMADKAMYDGKAKSRNIVFVAS